MPEDKAVEASAQMVEIGKSIQKLEDTVLEKTDGMASTEALDKVSTELAEEKTKTDDLSKQIKDLSGKLDNASKETVKVLDGYEDPDIAFGKFALHVVQAANGRIHDDLASHQKMHNEKFNQVEGIGSKGGFTVPAVLASGVHSLAWQNDPVLSKVTRISTNKTDLWKKNIKKQTDLREGIAAGAVTYRTAELEAMTLSEIAWEQIEIPITKLTTYTKASDELLEDSLENISSVLAKDMAISESEKIMSEFIAGTGVKQMEGIQQAPSLVTVAKESGQAADTIEYNNVIKMKNRMIQQFRSNAMWLIAPEVADQLPLMNLAIGTAGAPVYLPANGASVAGFDTLFGKQVVENSYLPTLGDLYDIMYVDPSQYWVIENGSKFDSTTELFWLTGQEAFKLVTRNGGKTWMPRQMPIRPSDSYIQGSVITLAERA